MSARREYTEEFKLDACNLVLDQHYTRTEAAHSLGINAPMLGRWIREFKSIDTEVFQGKGVLTGDQSTIRELRIEVKRLQQEKDILKKAATIFAVETQ